MMENLNKRTIIFGLNLERLLENGPKIKQQGKSWFVVTTRPVRGNLAVPSARGAEEDNFECFTGFAVL